MTIVTSVSLSRLKFCKVSKNKKRGVTKPHRNKRCLTTAEKATIKQLRARRRAAWQDALNEARDMLHEAAIAMQAKVPGHQLDYYVRAITQAITRSQVKPRKRVSKWNAYLSLETRRLNEGECVISFLGNQTLLTVYYINFRARTW
jgi:hypothetical protein